MYINLNTHMFCMPPVIEDPGASSVWSLCLCVCLSVRPASKVKVFQTAPNQTVFIAGLPYLAHIFTMSPPLHVLVPTFQVQGQGHLRTLDFGYSFSVARLKLFKLPKIKQFSLLAFRTWHIPSPCHLHFICTSATFKVKAGPSGFCVFCVFF
jgi:hypothetical protein